MSTGITTDDDIMTPLDGFEGDRPRGCQWDESVCTRSPGYRIAGAAEPHADHVPEATVDVYCARHYALALARLVETHSAECERTLAEHASAFGRIEDGR